MRYLTILLFLILISCGSVEKDFNKIITKEPKAPEKYWNSELISYVEEFINLAHYYDSLLLDIDILKIVDYAEFDETPTIGVCNIYDYKGKEIYREIKVNKEKHDIWFKQLIFHELGHCLLNLNHTNKRSDIMYPYRNSSQIVNFDKSVESMFLSARR